MILIGCSITKMNLLRGENEELRMKEEAMREGLFEELKSRQFENMDQFKVALNAEIVKKCSMASLKLHFSGLYSKAPKLSQSPFFEIKQKYNSISKTNLNCRYY